MTSIKELLEASDIVKVLAGMTESELGYKTRKLREIVEMMPEIKRALGRARGGKSTVRRWGTALKDKLAKWENN